MAYQSLLIIDDNPAHLQLLQRICSRMFPQFDIKGISTIPVLPELIEKVASGYDCVVCDYDLGSYKAVDVITALQASMPPCIVVSSRNDESVRKDSLDAGASGFVQKSHDLEFMASALSEAISPLLPLTSCAGM